MSLVELDPRAVRQAFDRAAPDYDRFAVLQAEVRERLLDRLDFLRREPARILDVGCGTGAALASLNERFPNTDLLALDWAYRMVQHAGRQDGGPSVVCADMHQVPLAAGCCDLLFSNLALQWSYDLPGLLAEFRRVLRPGAALLFSSFGPDTLNELRSAWSAVDRRQHVNRFMDMHDVGDALVRAGFTDPVMDIDRLTVWYPDPLTLMRELKAIGAHNAAQERPRGLTGRNTLRKVVDAYQRFRQEDAYPATYEVIYGLAFAPAEGQPVRGPDGEWASFSVESLRRRRGSSR